MCAQSGVCCAYIWNSSNRWQLVCNNPRGVSASGGGGDASLWPLRYRVGRRPADALYMGAKHCTQACMLLQQRVCNMIPRASAVRTLETLR